MPCVQASNIFGSQMWQMLWCCVSCFYCHVSGIGLSEGIFVWVWSRYCLVSGNGLSGSNNVRLSVWWVFVIQKLLQCRCRSRDGDGLDSCHRPPSVILPFVLWDWFDLFQQQIHHGQALFSMQAAGDRFWCNCLLLQIHWLRFFHRSHCVHHKFQPQ